jgi:hypothetical protein
VPVRSPARPNQADEWYRPEDYVEWDQWMEEAIPLPPLPQPVATAAAAAPSVHLTLLCNVACDFRPPNTLLRVLDPDLPAEEPPAPVGGRPHRPPLFYKFPGPVQAETHTFQLLTQDRVRTSLSATAFPPNTTLFLDPLRFHWSFIDRWSSQFYSEFAGLDPSLEDDTYNIYHVLFNVYYAFEEHFRRYEETKCCPVFATPRLHMWKRQIIACLLVPFNVTLHHERCVGKKSFFFTVAGGRVPHPDEISTAVKAATKVVAQGGEEEE